MVSEKVIKKNNLEAEIVVLSQKKDKKEEELNSMTSAVDEAKALIAESKRLKEETTNYITKETANLDKAKSDFAQEKIQYSHDKEHGASNLENLLSKIKIANKELVHLNSSCLIAKQELEKVNKDISNLNSKIVELTGLVVYYEEIKEKIRLSEIELERVTLLIVESATKSNREVLEAREQLATIRNESQVMILKRDHAEYQLKSYTDQLYTAMNDWEVIRARLEKRWKELYPELDIPLMV